MPTPNRLLPTFVTVLLFVCLAAPAVPAGEWVLLEVPGAWDKQEATLEDYRGYAWYRCYVKVPPHWIDDDHPRELWAGSITVGIDGQRGAYELFVNGREIARAGQMPPDFKPSETGPRRHNVPVGTLHEGLNVIALRVHSGPNDSGGFHGPPPVISGYYKEIVLQGPWEFRIGDEAAWAEGGDEPLSDKVIYDEAVDATTPLHRPAELIHGPRLEPDEALAALQPAADLAVDQVLADPTIAQPISLEFDERGRLWVVEYLQYPWPEGLTSVSRDKYYRFVYDQPLPPPPYKPDSPFRGQDRISVHEDTNGDGLFDKHSVVIDGLNITTAALPVSDGVWVLSPPQLLFFPFDENGQPESTPEVHLDGFGIEDTHSTASSLTWGPDGWLYGTQGMTVTTRIELPDSEGESIYRQGAMIWRYYPPTRRFEVFAEGGGNTFSMEIDAQGRVLTGHNGGATRGFDFHQDGYYDKGGSGRFGPMSNPYTFGLLPPMEADGPIVRFSSAALVYDAAALPDRYHGSLLCADPLHNFLVLAERTAAGSTFTTSDLDHALRSEDTAFRPVTLSLGPDGAVYIADFYEHYIAHGQNYSGMIDPTSGRVYRLRAQEHQALEPFDLRQSSAAELVELLGHDNRWFRRAALRLIGERGDRSILPQLKELIGGDNEQLALEALWAVNLLGGLDEALALETLSHPDPHLRRWTVRFAGDDHRTTPRIAERLAAMAFIEPDAEVRSQLASTARRLPTEQGMPIAGGLLHRTQDVADAHIPLLLWWAIEARCGDEREEVLELFDSPAIWDLPMVEQHMLSRLMRRFAATGLRRDLVTCATLLDMAPRDSHRQLLLSGLEQGLAGRTLADPPQPLVEALARAGGGSLILRLRQGEAEAIDQALQMIRDPNADPTERRRVMEFFGQIREDRSVPLLLEAAASEPDTSLRRVALGSLQAYDTLEIGRRVVELYSQLPAEARSAALAVLASRAAWSIELVEAIEAGAIPVEAVPTEIVRQIELHDDPTLERLVRQIWTNATAGLPEDAQQRIAQLKQMLRAAEGNPHRGRGLFIENCGACHRLFDDGGDIGPDLTSWGRDDVDRLLQAIVDPSADIREGYEHYMVITHDGRTLSGFLADQDPQTVVVRDLAGQDVTLRREQIEHKQLLDHSLMPENILDALTDQQIRDLFAHLQAGQPSPD